MNEIISLPEAYNQLRTEENDGNTDIILGLLAAIPGYIKTATGVKDPATASLDYPLLATLAKFLLTLWYNPDGTDAQQLQRVVDNLLKTIKADADEINAALEAV